MTNPFMRLRQVTLSNYRNNITPSLRRSQAYQHSFTIATYSFTNSIKPQSANFSSSSSIPSSRVYDLAIIGGGIIGLSCARELQLRYPNRRIILLEAESHLCQHQSSHNSGVIHAGIYYQPGSQRAELCRIGSERMYQYCEDHGIPYKKVGKLIVARDESELPGLEELMKRGRLNGCADLKYLNSRELSVKEPLLQGHTGIWSPTTGVVNFERVGQKMAEQLRNKGGKIQNQFRLTTVRDEGEWYRLEQASSSSPSSFSSSSSSRSSSSSSSSYHDHGSHPVLARKILTCCGLYSDRIVELFQPKAKATKYESTSSIAHSYTTTISPPPPSSSSFASNSASSSLSSSVGPPIIPVRGSWMQFKPQYRHLIRHNIYPVPNPSFPFLGVHFTPTLDFYTGEVNGILIGPNAVLATSREGYSVTDWNIGDIMDMLRHRGMHTLIRRHWRFGATELVSELFPSIALAACQSYIPTLRWDHIQQYRPMPNILPHYHRPILQSGVRAQALREDGKLEEDFIIQKQQTIGEECINIRITNATNSRMPSSSPSSSPSASPSSTRSFDSHLCSIVHVRNSPSPAATSSILIGEHVANQVTLLFQW